MEIFESAIILLTKTTAARNEVALSYHRVRGLYFPAVVFVPTIVLIYHKLCTYERSYICPLYIAVNDMYIVQITNYGKLRTIE